MTGPTRMHRLLPAALVLAIATGVFHIYIGALNLAGMNPAVPVEARTPSGVGFVGMGVIYLVGVGLIATNVKRSLWTKVGLGYAIVLIAAWAAAAAADFPGTREPFAYVDKVIEVVLVVLLVKMVRDSRAPAPKPEAAAQA